MTILGGAILVTLGILPDAADSALSVPAYDWVFSYFIPFSIPLLLFNVPLKKIIRETGALLLPFLIGALGVVLGAIVASLVLPLGEETYKVAGTFVGTYIGGSVNFMAVATALNFVESPLFPSAITVDNVFTNLYIILLFGLSAVNGLVKQFPAYSEDEPTAAETPPDLPVSSGFLMEQITMSLLIASVLFAAAQSLSPWVAGLLGTDFSFDVVLLTTFIIVLVNAFPTFFARYQAVAFDMGMFLMYVFLAVIGASSNLLELLTSVPGMLAFATIILSVHLLVSLIGGKLLKVSLKEILVASCANAAGPSVAAPMAVSMGMKRAVTPAILVGLLGYVIGTFLGVGIGALLQ